MTHHFARLATAICASMVTTGATALAQSAMAPSRTTTTVTYEARRTTGIDLVGTPLVPRSRGEAEIRTAAAGPLRIVQAEGFTDSTGGAAVNERLSLQRADAVRGFLLAQGLPSDRVTALGCGASHPVAGNETREGRQQNRRVELVVAGDVIGTPIGSLR